MNKLRIVPAQLARKVTLAFGFLAFIPLLLIFWASVSFIFPHLQDSQQSTLRLLIVAIIASIFLGYVVLKRTMGAIMVIVRQAKTVSRQQVGEADVAAGGQDDVGELARTFNRITQELEHKIHELESSRDMVKRLLSRIGTAIISYEGIDHLLELIVENAAVALEAQKGSLLLLDGATQTLELKATWMEGSLSAGAPARRRMKLGEGIAGWVAKERRMMRNTALPSAIGLLDAGEREGAVVCVPLLVHDKVLGALAVFRNSAARAFIEDDVVLMANIGSQIAVAIENYRLNLDIEQTYLDTVTALALAVEAKEAYTAGHSKRVACYAVQIAEAMGLDEQTKKVLQYGGVLHDVGKIGIKDGILLKGENLTSEERQVMQEHPRIGEAILKPLRSLTSVAELVRCHHERYDGSGYPQGLKETDIPLTARILTVADSYDAMVTDRPYRKRMSLEEAMAELRKGVGVQFDPQVVDTFLKLLAQKHQ